jgi:3-hydroxyacyl-CoA dehydrogenase
MEINKVAQVGQATWAEESPSPSRRPGCRSGSPTSTPRRPAEPTSVCWGRRSSSRRRGCSPGSTDRIRANLHVASTIEEAVTDVDFIEEAVPEVPQIKRDVLARVEAAAKPGTIIGTNSSTIPVHVLAEGLRDPSRFLTVHWSNPAPFIPGVEIVAEAHTDPSVIPW